MSAYLVNAIAAQPMIKVHLNTEVVGGHGDGQLEWVTLRERNSGQEQHLPLESLFVMIGARPRTDWLPADVDRDQHGFLYTEPTQRPAIRGNLHVPPRARNDYPWALCCRRRAIGLGQTGGVRRRRRVSRRLRNPPVPSCADGPKWLSPRAGAARASL